MYLYQLVNSSKGVFSTGEFSNWPTCVLLWTLAPDKCIAIIGLGDPQTGTVSFSHGRFEAVDIFPGLSRVFMRLLGNIARVLGGVPEVFTVHQHLFTREGFQNWVLVMNVTNILNVLALTLFNSASQIARRFISIPPHGSKKCAVDPRRLRRGIQGTLARGL